VIHYWYKHPLSPDEGWDERIEKLTLFVPLLWPFKDYMLVDCLADACGV
jgi:hypothetical protein